MEGPEPAVRAWLFKTATHLIRDRYRVDQNRRRLLQENPVTPAALDGPDRQLERAEDRARARAALDRIPDRDREILLMRYEGFSYKEVAEIVELPVTAVLALTED